MNILNLFKRRPVGPKPKETLVKLTEDQTLAVAMLWDEHMAKNTAQSRFHLWKRINDLSPVPVEWREDMGNFKNVTRELKRDNAVMYSVLVREAR